MKLNKKDKNKRKTKEWGQLKKSTGIFLSVLLAVVLITAILFAIPLNGKDSFSIGKSNYDFFWVSKAIKLGLDLEGGMYALYDADLSPFSTTEEENSAMSGTIANLQALLFAEGYTEATVIKQGRSNIRVEIPAIEDTEHLMNILGEPATLEFKDEEGNVLIKGGQDLKRAVETLYEGGYAISLEFNDSGKAKFAEATSQNVGRTLAIYINGSKVIEPKVNAAITDGRAVITGGYDYNTAKDLATKINAGTLQVKLSPISSATISPTLGQNALTYGLIAGFIGLILIIILLIVLYRGLGVVASLALVIYTTLMIYLLALVPWVQLTLPSIAGVILSIGMAVDANIIIFERIKDEKAEGGIGKGMITSIEYGFRKALPAIIDGNVTTILGCIVMIIFGAATIKSFGITLLIGILLSMFSALIVTKFILMIFLSFSSDNEDFYGLGIKEIKHEK